MWIQVPPSKGKMTPYLAVLTRLGILEDKACSRAELETRQINYTAANRKMS